MHNFWVDQTRPADGRIVLSHAESHHIISVLRLKTGEELGLLDGRGTVYQARIAHIERDWVEVEILSLRHHPPPKTAIYLGQGVLKGKKMDLLYQKATELGVAGFHPFFSSRCVIKERSADQQDRWRQISIEACKQCGRPYLPRSQPATDFDEILLSGQGVDYRFILWEGECQSLKAVLTLCPPRGSVLFLTGPEGGFSTEEADRARAASFLPVSLGKSVLRSETAALAMLSILQFHFDGF